jgi:hypothetical protein
MMSVRARHLLGLAVLAAALPASAFATGFPIANLAVRESPGAVAFDGTNFLVAVQQRGGGGVRAQLVSPSGALLGTVLIPRSGDPALIGFDGTNYLLVWNEPTTPLPDGPGIYGQLVSKQATTVGATFRISQSTNLREADGLAFDGTRYLVVWSNIRPLVSERDIYGRFVSTAGVPEGNDFDIDDGAGVEATVAFGASRYLVAWNEDVANSETRARFVDTNGALGTAFPVNSSAPPSDNGGSIAFDGNNFLVVWSDDMGGTQSLDFFGQLVSPAGALVGGVVPIATAPGPQILPYIAYDGLNYLITWTDLFNTGGGFGCGPMNGTCLDVHGQLLGDSGSLVGTNFPVVVDPLNQGLSPVAWGAGKYLVAWIEAVGESNEDVFGNFILSDPIFIDGFEPGAP